MENFELLMNILKNKPCRLALSIARIAHITWVCVS